MIDKRFGFAIFFFLLPIIVICQFQIDWQQCYGSMDYDQAHDIAILNNGFIVIGFVQDGGLNVTCTQEPAFWILNLDSSGNVLWQRCYEHAGAFRIAKNFSIEAEYFLIGGARENPYPDAYNLWVSKMDSTGGLIWERVLGNTIGILGGDQFGQPTTDGGVIATAQIDSKGGDISNWYGWYDGWIVKLDSTGNLDWELTIGSSEHEFVNCIVEAENGNYTAGLYGNPYGETGNINCQCPGEDSDAILFHLDSNGVPLWDRCYGGSGDDGIHTLIEIEDGYMIAAWGNSNDGDLVGSGWHGEKDIWLIRTDYNGNIIWQKCYGGSNIEYPSSIFQTSDGGFVVFANTKSNDGDVIGNIISDQPTVWIFKIDSNGLLQWQKCIHSTATERVHGVVKHSDYKYTFAGEMIYSPTYDVNCSNFVYGSRTNYWVVGISDTIVGLSENEAVCDMDFNFQIYPNPATNHIYCNWNPIGEILMVRIYNMFGHEMGSYGLTRTQNQIEIDTSKFPSGVYVAVLFSKGSIIDRKQFVVK